jgi:hypothetical protein
MSHEWPHEKLSTIIGRPTLAHMIRMKGQIFANAISLPNDGCDLGHLGLLLPEALYILEHGSNGTPYVPPANPGRDPLDNSSAQARLWKREKTEYEVYRLGRTRLVSQMIKCMDETWTYDLQTPGRQYQLCTPEQVYMYLMTQYGKVTPQEISQNRAKLHEPWDDNMPIGKLWAKVAETCAFATFCNRPITESDKIVDTIGVLIKCKKYERCIETWHDKPIEDQTWNNLVAHFDRFEDNHMHITTVRNSPFHTANAVDATALMTPADSKPSANVASSTGTPAKPTRENNFYLPKHCVALSYCHSCGWQTNLAHNSATCRTMQPGHDKTATSSDKGGSDKVDLKLKHRPNTKKRKMGNNNN